MSLFQTDAFFQPEGLFERSDERRSVRVNPRMQTASKGRFRVNSLALSATLALAALSSASTPSSASASPSAKVFSGLESSMTEVAVVGVVRSDDKTRELRDFARQTWEAAPQMSRADAAAEFRRVMRRISDRLHSNQG